MKRTIIIFFLFTISSVFAGPDELNRYFIEAAGNVKNSVVNIIIYEKSGDKSIKKIAYGTGTIISKSGYVVTNYHVMKKGNYCKIINSSGETFSFDKIDGKIFVADQKTDIAILKISNSDGSDFIPVKFADSNKIEEGEWVLAIGNPYGLRQSITSGIISSKGRDSIGFADIEDFIQTDVSINPGNSGGPLVNLYGDVVGINTAIRTNSGGYQGISFAIPSNIVKLVCDELIKYGRVRRGWLGFLANEKKSVPAGKNEITVMSVISKSPAEKAGIKKNDIIKKIDGEKVLTVGAVLKAVGNKTIGSNVKITVTRNDEEKEFNLILREKHDYFEIQERIENLFSEYGIDVDENSESGGPVVTYSSPERLSSGIKKGDMIVSVNGEKTDSLKKFLSIAAKKKIQFMEVSRDSAIYEISFEEIK